MYKTKYKIGTKLKQPLFDNIDSFIYYFVYYIFKELIMKLIVIVHHNTNIIILNQSIH